MTALALTLAALLQAPPPEDAETPEAEASGPWAGSSVSGGAAFLSGNSRSLLLSGDLVAEYQQAPWSFQAEVSGVYGFAASAGDSEEEAEPSSEWLHGTARLERDLTGWLTGFGLVGGVINHPASLQGRVEGEVGLGVNVFNVERGDEQVFLLRLYLGAHVSNDYRFQFFPVRSDLPDVFNAGPGAGGRLSWKINDRIALTQTAAFYPNVVGDYRAIGYSDTELSSFFTEKLALSLHLLVEYDSSPAPDRQTTDAALTVGLEYQL